MTQDPPQDDGDDKDDVVDTPLWTGDDDDDSQQGQGPGALLLWGE